jgi:DNA-binding transcriptional ArsR family regulator
MADAGRNIDQVFHALGDPTRREILEKLNAVPQSLSRLALPLDITLTAVVQHVRVLEESGLVQTEKTGRVRTCRIDRTGFGVLQKWIDDCRSIWEQRLDRPGELLEESDAWSSGAAVESGITPAELNRDSDFLGRSDTD